MTLTMTLFDPAAPGFGENPWHAYAALRDQPGLYWHEPFGGWLASRFADVQAIATDRRMVRSAAVFLPPDQVRQMQRQANFHDMPFHERFVQTSMLEIDGPDHDRLRRAVFPFFTRTRLESLRPAIAATADALIRDLLPRGRIDFIADLASDLPGRIIGRLIGVPDEDSRQMTGWSEDVVSYFDIDRTAEKKARAEQATVLFHDYLVCLRDERITRPRDDLMTALIGAESRGDLRGDELIAAVMQILHAGHGSTIDVLGSGLHALLTHPDQMQRLRDDPALMPLAVQEMFRWAAPLPFFHRYASTDLTVAGRDWPQGTKFALLYAAANRDPAAFPEPDRFDVARSPNRHIAFGGGPHVCLGNNLSRMNMEAIFTALLARTSQIALDGPVVWKAGLQAHGPTSLPISMA
ncbi:MAG: cytochrome P450 [Paracoccus sp. (in: a-proteobacteria)]|uniref:cytochrome P450 n=1 Tax=Paracoccus sp. TaxID=267 RepID=UPI0026DEADC2|nr:cytochrome P450 [Paracoccus sp. (in: a-proteobacteria)]MDO5612643.1 cytochrome P450 [Paracoccus sp. (in: a-proteobacteria)]